MSPNIKIILSAKQKTSKPNKKKAIEEENK